MLQYNGGTYYTNFKEMGRWLIGKSIFDENGVKVSRKDFCELVEAKQKEKEAGGTRQGLIQIDGYDFYDQKFS